MKNRILTAIVLLGVVTFLLVVYSHAQKEKTMYMPANMRGEEASPYLTKAQGKINSPIDDSMRLSNPFWVTK